MKIKDILIKIPEGDNKKTVLQILNEKLCLSKNAVKNLKFHGKILVNKEKVTVRYELKTGDELFLSFYEKPSKNIEPENIPLDILYEDENILAVNKMSSMPTHPSQNNRSKTLANAVMGYFDKKGERLTFRALNRLDKYTSGVVIIAKNAVSAAAVSKTLKNAKKTYIAVLTNPPGTDSGKITAPIGRCGGSIIKRTVRPDGKYAETHYKILKRKNSLALAEIKIKTGRTHQIRVHMSYIGSAVYSDFLYGEEIKGVRMMLHCKSIEFLNPFTDKIQTISAPVRDDIIKMFD